MIAAWTYQRQELVMVSPVIVEFYLSDELYLYPAVLYLPRLPVQRHVHLISPVRQMSH